MIFDNQVIVLNKFKWFNYKFEHISIHLTVRMPENLIHELLNVLNNRDHSFILNNFKKVLDKRLTMQYSIIVHAPDFLIAAVDAIRSYPIYFTKNGDFIISDDFKTIF